MRPPEAVTFSEEELIFASVHDIIPRIQSAFSPSGCPRVAG
jgi:hypothetical protein